MSDRRSKGQPVPTPDAMEEAVLHENAGRPQMPLLIAPATNMRTQAVTLPGSTLTGVAVEVSNAVVTMAFPMTPEQTRQHIKDCELALLESAGIVTDATMDEAGAEARRSTLLRGL